MTPPQHILVFKYPSRDRVKFWLLRSFFSNYKFTINQRKAFLIEKFSWLLCFRVSKLFNSLMYIKIEFESRLYCIDIIAYHCISSAKSLLVIVKSYQRGNVLRPNFEVKLEIPKCWNSFICKMFVLVRQMVWKPGGLKA